MFIVIRYCVSLSWIGRIGRSNRPHRVQQQGPALELCPAHHAEQQGRPKAGKVVYHLPSSQLQVTALRFCFLSHSRNSSCFITPRCCVEQPYGAARSLIDLFHLCLLTENISFTPQYQCGSNRLAGYEDCLTCRDSGGEHTHIILFNYLQSGISSPRAVPFIFFCC